MSSNPNDASERGEGVSSREETPIDTRYTSLNPREGQEGGDIDDEDDPDYEDANVTNEEEDDDDEDPDFFDAADLLEEDDEEEVDEDAEGGTFTITWGDDDDDEDGEGGGTAHVETAIPLAALLRSGGLNGRQILELIQGYGVGGLGEDDDDDMDDLPWGMRRRRRRAPKDPNRFPKVPSDEGIKLQRSGVFGANDVDQHNRRVRKHIARRMLERELGLGDASSRRQNNDLLTQSLIPSTRAEHIIHYDDPIYSGQFSDDGNFFFSVCQDFTVRMYDTSNPYEWKHYKSAHYPWGRWTLTDASLSPDNKWLAYTSISPLVSIAPTDPLDRGDPYTLDLSGSDRPVGAFGRGGNVRGIFSIRFSGDGRELVAGTSSNALVVYDIDSRRVLHHIEGHEDDVNAVCFADKMSPHILYSGSDDATIKVWDRRSMGDKREAGAFVGHQEGLTYIDSKGDGRYILSNGKDQSMKLWDLRMVMSTDRYRELDPMTKTRFSGYDYRVSHYDDEDWDVHPDDNSLVTFRGHQVLNTLIRCHFSPPSATNSRYVYSGSRDGKVYVWNMDATIADVIDVRKATMGSRPNDGHRGFFRADGGGWSTCVRDASWHPNAPFIVGKSLLILTHSTKLTIISVRLERLQHVSRNRDIAFFQRRSRRRGRSTNVTVA